MMNDSDQFNVNLNNFSGSLDLLLDLAKSQKVNLENISITKLADQFYEFIKNEKTLITKSFPSLIECAKYISLSKK